MATKVTNRECRPLVEARKEFQGSNLYGVQQGNLYIVYSYGPHFPLYVFDDTTQQWYRNVDRYSMTTSHHRSRACPNDVEFHDCDTDWLRKFIYEHLRKLINEHLRRLNDGDSA